MKITEIKLEDFNVKYNYYLGGNKSEHPYSEDSKKFLFPANHKYPHPPKKKISFLEGNRMLYYFTNDEHLEYLSLDFTILHNPNFRPPKDIKASHLYALIIYLSDVKSNEINRISKFLRIAARLLISLKSSLNVSIDFPKKTLFLHYLIENTHQDLARRGLILKHVLKLPEARLAINHQDSAGATVADLLLAEEKVDLTSLKLLMDVCQDSKVTLQFPMACREKMPALQEAIKRQDINLLRFFLTNPTLLARMDQDSLTELAFFAILKNDKFSYELLNLLHQRDVDIELPLALVGSEQFSRYVISDEVKNDADLHFQLQQYKHLLYQRRLTDIILGKFFLENFEIKSESQLKKLEKIITWQPRFSERIYHYVLSLPEDLRFSLIYTILQKKPDETSNLLSLAWAKTAYLEKISALIKDQLSSSAKDEKVGDWALRLTRHIEAEEKYFFQFSSLQNPIPEISKKPHISIENILQKKVKDEKLDETKSLLSSFAVAIIENNIDEINKSTLDELKKDKDIDLALAIIGPSNIGSLSHRIKKTHPGFAIFLQGKYEKANQSWQQKQLETLLFRLLKAHDDSKLLAPLTVVPKLAERLFNLIIDKTVSKEEGCNHEFYIRHLVYSFCNTQHPLYSIWSFSKEIYTKVYYKILEPRYLPYLLEKIEQGEVKKELLDHYLKQPNFKESVLNYFRQLKDPKKSYIFLIQSLTHLGHPFYPIWHVQRGGKTVNSSRGVYREAINEVENLARSLIQQEQRQLASWLQSNTTFFSLEGIMQKVTAENIIDYFVQYQNFSPAPHAENPEQQEPAELGLDSKAESQEEKNWALDKNKLKFWMLDLIEYPNLCSPHIDFDINIPKEEKFPGELDINFKKLHGEFCFLAQQLATQVVSLIHRKDIEATFITLNQIAMCNDYKKRIVKKEFNLDEELIAGFVYSSRECSDNALQRLIKQFNALMTPSGVSASRFSFSTSPHPNLTACDHNVFGARS